jgi:hypothetical protein
MSWSVYPLLGETTLRAFCLSALWQIYETLYLLWQGAGMQIYNPFSDAGMQIYNSFSGCRNFSALHEGWETHSSAL